MVDCSGRTSMVEGDQHRLAVAEANDFRIGPAHHREPEHLLIKRDGTLQVRDMNADVVDIRGLKLDLILSRGGGGPSTGSQQRETGDQVPTTQRALFKAGYEIGNDRFHDEPLSLAKSRAKRRRAKAPNNGPRRLGESAAPAAFAARPNIGPSCRQSIPLSAQK